MQCCACYGSLCFAAIRKGGGSGHDDTLAEAKRSSKKKLACELEMGRRLTGMAKRLTVFYSWQSDSPSKLNRSFIEKALQEALKRLHSDATLENALRDTTVELDKDTMGIAGSPPIPQGGKLYLRLRPTATVLPINSELEARSLASNGNLQPLGRVSACGFDRNIFGSIVYEQPANGKLYHFTQLFLSREIWGVDAMILDADYLRSRIKDFSGPHIANGYIEKEFVRALHNYLIFAQTHLQLPLPLQIEAGLAGIKGYPVTLDSLNMAGKALRDVIQWQVELTTYGKPAWEILGPFFDRIWDNCGIQRTSAHQAELVKQFVR